MVRLEVPGGTSKETVCPTGATVGVGAATPSTRSGTVQPDGNGVARAGQLDRLDGLHACAGAGLGTVPLASVAGVPGVQLPAGSSATHRPSKQKLPSSQIAELSQDPSDVGQPAAARARARRGIAAARGLNEIVTASVLWGGEREREV
jgi:hypothetical protein